MDKIQQIEENTNKLLSHFKTSNFENHSEPKLLNSELIAPFIKIESKDIIGDIEFTQNRIVTNKQKEQVIFTKKFNDKLIELESNGFELFDQTIMLLLDVFYKNNISKEFLNNNLFSWCYKVVSTGNFSENFYTYIESEISKNTKEYKFAFLVSNLAIDSDIEFKDVKISYFKDSNFKDVLKDDKTQFKIPFIGDTYITTTIKGDKIQAEIIAFKKCGYVIDVLKFYHPALLRANLRCTTELKKRLDFQITNDVFKLELESVVGHKMTGIDENYIFKLNDIELLNAKKRGLDFFIDFILKEPKTEFESLITLCIELYSRALSEYDLHIRAVQIVTIFETIFLKESDKTDPAKNRVTFFNHINNNLDKPVNVFVHLNNFFQIRHSFIHKSIRTDIDEIEFAFIQKLLVNLLLKIITSKSNHNTKSEFIDYLDTNGQEIYEGLNLYYKENLKPKKKNKFVV